MVDVCCFVESSPVPSSQRPWSGRNTGVRGSRKPLADGFPTSNECLADGIRGTGEHSGRLFLAGSVNVIC